MDTTNNKKKKRIYQCVYYEYDYDDLGKDAWCHNPKCVNRECIIEYEQCQNLCPFFKRKNNHYTLIDDEQYKKLCDFCKDELKQKIEDAIKDAEHAVLIANKKMKYAKTLKSKIRY